MKQKEARDFWMRKFAPSVTVSTTVFLERFREEFEFTCDAEVKAFQKSIDLCDDEMVSWWEFDIFARLYDPWDRILNTWNVIVTKHPGYRAWSTYEQVKNALEPFISKPGSYVFRLSVTRPGQWAIGFVHPGGRILQAIPEGKSLYQALIDGALDGTYIYPQGLDVNVDLRQHMPVTAADHITVSFEENEIYAKVDSKFETCKICVVNNKDYRIEPCGHLMCRECFDEWSVAQAGTTTCPFCRGPIVSSNMVVVEAYKPEGPRAIAEGGGGGPGGGAAAAAAGGGGGGGGNSAGADGAGAASGPAAAKAMRREVNNRTFREDSNTGLSWQEQRILRRNQSDEQAALGDAVELVAHTSPSNSNSNSAEAEAPPPPVPARRMSLGSNQLEDMRIFAANTSHAAAAGAAGSAATTGRRSTSSVDDSALARRPSAQNQLGSRTTGVMRRGSFNMGMLRSQTGGETASFVREQVHGAAANMYGEVGGGNNGGPGSDSSSSEDSDGDGNNDHTLPPIHQGFPRSQSPYLARSNSGGNGRPPSANTFLEGQSSALSPMHSSTSDQFNYDIAAALTLISSSNPVVSTSPSSGTAATAAAAAAAAVHLPPLSRREQELERMFANGGNFDDDDAAIQMMTRSELIDAIGAHINDSSELDTIIGAFDHMSDMMYPDDQPDDRGGPMARTEAFSQSVSDLAELTFNRVLQAEAAIAKAEARGNLINTALYAMANADAATNSATTNDMLGRIPSDDLRAVETIGEVTYGSGSSSEEDSDDDGDHRHHYNRNHNVDIDGNGEGGGPQRRHPAPLTVDGGDDFNANVNGGEFTEPPHSPSPNEMATVVQGRNWDDGGGGGNVDGDGNYGEEEDDSESADMTAIVEAQVTADSTGAVSSTANEFRRASSFVYNEVLRGSASTTGRPTCPDEAPPPRPPSPSSAPPPPPPPRSSLQNPDALRAHRASGGGGRLAENGDVFNEQPLSPTSSDVAALVQGWNWDVDADAEGGNGGPQQTGEGIYGDVDNLYVPGPTRTGAPAAYNPFSDASGSDSSDDDMLPAAPTIAACEGLRLDLQAGLLQNLQEVPTPPTPTFAAPSTPNFDLRRSSSDSGDGLAPPPPPPRSSAQNPDALRALRLRIQAEAGRGIEPDYFPGDGQQAQEQRQQHGSPPGAFNFTNM
eukprot:gene3299-5055_t